MDSALLDDNVCKFLKSNPILNCEKINSQHFKKPKNNVDTILHMRELVSWQQEQTNYVIHRMPTKNHSSP